MPRNIKNTGNKVFDALAAPLRLEILRLVYSQGPLSYSEIMSRLNMNPNRDAGKFAYHLKKLNNAGILATDEQKKYTFTPLGNLMIEVTQNVEEESLKQRRQLLVRTSRLAMEVFDRNKIVRALMREAGVPSQLARRIAEESEERLLKLDTLYLTAPLIREFVNSILVEKGLHEYRHRLTRLGLPVYDVTQTIKQARTTKSGIRGIGDLMAKNVLTEYVLLNALPRRVADAHLDSTLHLKDVDDWILRPQSIQHDLRPLLREGFVMGKNATYMLSLGPPRNLSSALGIIDSVLSTCAQEVSCEQTIPHFNTFLAPYVQGMSDEELKNSVKQFVVHLNQLSSSSIRSSLSLCLDITSPANLEQMVAVQPEVKVDSYGSFTEEANRITSALIDFLVNNDGNVPVLNPHFIFNITRKSLSDGETQYIVKQAHDLASKTGTPIFANLSPSWQNSASYMSDGTRLAADWRKDWELDTVRTGTLGTVGVNLPRIVYESKGNDSKLRNILSERLSLATEALRIKANSIESFFSNRLLSFISHSVADESYFRLKNAQFLVSLVGLNEATKSWTGKQIHEGEEASGFASKVLNQLSDEAGKLSQKTDDRIALTYGILDESPQRMAEMDVERHGWGIVNAQGSRDAPYYTDMTVSPLGADISLQERLRLESTFQPMALGGHFLPIELSEPLQDPESLLALTKDIVGSYNIGAYAFTRTYGYCYNCKKIQGGHNQKCSSCGTEEAYVTFSRLSSDYGSIDYWPKYKLNTLDSRKRYHMT